MLHFDLGRKKRELFDAKNLNSDAEMRCQGVANSRYEKRKGIPVMENDFEKINLNGFFFCVAFLINVLKISFWM